jgi:glycosyltransferase involved in cell wall biosynthesis
VVTDTGGNPEVVVDGTSGLLFPVGDAEQLARKLLFLRGDRDSRERLGRQALQRVEEHFSLDAMIANYEQMYETLAGHRAELHAESRKAVCGMVR